jgi:asparagine synthase (glutamine-hydrolysing)
MCGLAGRILSGVDRFDGVPGVKEILRHRGPDDYGTWSDETVAFYHWRLSVVDLSEAGHQPMLSAEGRYIIAFNGEIYNHLEIRAQLEEEVAGERRISWRGHSDTETLIEAFSWWGKDLFPRLNGMFAIAIYDAERRCLWLVRDRHGIKPLYIWEHGRYFAFASEAKFFFAVPNFLPEINSEGLKNFFTYGHSGEQRMLKGVRQLEPGEQLRLGLCSEGILTKASSRFCSFPTWKPTLGRPAAVKQVQTLLRASVRRHLMADVPVGVFLSGGIDSSILTSLAAEILGPRQTKCFTLGYRDCGSDYNEVANARAVAEHLGVQHYVYEACASDFIGMIEKMVWHYDEPFADAAALNMLVLSRMVRSHVTVALAGEGADELFGGYRRYRVEACLRRIEPLLRHVRGLLRAADGSIRRLPRRLSILLRGLRATNPARRYSAYFESGTALDELLQSEWNSNFEPIGKLMELYPEELTTSPVAALCLADQRFWLPDTYLEKSDKGSMAFSLEVRVPFLDNDVVEFANSLPDCLRVRWNKGKWLLREAFGDRLPKKVFKGFKRGFAVPISEWFRKDLGDYFAERVLSGTAMSRRYLHQACLFQLYRQHCRRDRDYSLALWQALVFEIWLRQVEKGFRGPAATDPVDKVGTGHSLIGEPE